MGRINYLYKAFIKWNKDIRDIKSIYNELFIDYIKYKDKILVSDDLNKYIKDTSLSDEIKSIVCYLMALNSRDLKEKILYLEMGFLVYKDNYALIFEGLKCGQSIGNVNYKEIISLDLEFLNYIDYNANKSDIQDFEFCVVSGGNSIGASCYLLKFDGINVMVDAGTKFGTNDEIIYPDFNMLKKFGLSGIEDVDLVILTHAHLDHVGAVTEIYKAACEKNIKIPIYMTRETKDLTYKNLSSSISKQDKPSERYYLEKWLSDVTILDFNEKTIVKKDEKKIEIELFRAGHILGAASIYFNFNGKGIFLTGDYCLHNQLTVKGMDIPQNYNIDLLISESTYGSKIYDESYTREIEEELFLRYIIKNMRKSKKALIPAFALGRAQEIILMIKNYFRSINRVPFRVYIDGMVTDVCENFSQYIKEDFTCKGIFIANKNQGYSSKEEFIENEVLHHKCCVISSSGMLKDGSASSYYAEKFVDDENSLCIITGYQDEESVGGRLKQLTNQKGNKYIEINGNIHRVKCDIAEYYLSAHCHIEDMINLVLVLKPSRVCLIHGTVNEEEKSELYRKLCLIKQLDVIQTVDGKKYIFKS